MSTRLAVFQNGDDALLVWNISEALDHCRGFAIERKLSREGQVQQAWLDNHVGFAGEDHKSGEKRSSTEWPFQGFQWTDHEVGTGDSAQYRVVPVARPDGGGLELQEELASDWSDAPANPNDAPTPYWAYFNRGYVMSQFMARYLAEKGLTAEEFKEKISSEDEEAIRAFLSGDLRLQMLKLLDDAKQDGGHIYLAVFELSDDELVAKLAALGPRAHLVLANGSIAAKKGEKSADARLHDENEKARAALRKADVDVDEKNRFVSPKPLSHNKFLVVTDKDEIAQVAWTGSTNWTPTGLCTQLNNGILIRDPTIAVLYLEQWHRLRSAKSEFPESLVNENSQAKSPAAAPHATVWFSRTTDEVDLTALRDVVHEAKKAILFQMFMPGSKGLLKDVEDRRKGGDLYVRGVVSQLPTPGEEKVVEVTAVGAGEPTSEQLNVIQPEGMHPFAYWAAEVTNKQFHSEIGYAIVHSKVVVIDPFSDQATVITGSHNFSGSASTANDENFIIIRRNQPLAEAYLVNILGSWRHYRARINQGHFDGLKDSDDWLQGSLAARNDETSFWGF